MIRIVHVGHITRCTTVIHRRANVHEIIGVEVIAQFARVEQFIVLKVSIRLLVNDQLMSIKVIVIDLLGGGHWHQLS